MKINLKKPELVAMPKFEEVTAENFSQKLIDWYKALGWNNKNQMLDVKKVKVCRKDWNVIVDAILATEAEGVSAFSLNYSPSEDASVPEGRVMLMVGWVTEE